MMNDWMLEANQMAMLQTLPKEMEEICQKNKEEVVVRRKNEEEVRILKEKNEQMRRQLFEPILGVGHGQHRQTPPQRIQHTQNQERITQTQAYQSSRPHTKRTLFL